MIEITDKAKCCGCLACVSACPVSCIAVESDAEGFAYPAVDAVRCIGCNQCESICPFISPSGNAPVMSTYAAKSGDDSLRHTSSSGGLFTELCRPILAAGGVVYGVVMDNDNRSCSFSRAEGMDGIMPMRGSKYLQACSRGVYELVKTDLNAGREVLFSGTPCQTNALVSYLGGRKDGLLVVDCVCHGVPSPRLWAENVANLEAKEGKRVESVNFRCKEISWRQFWPGEFMGRDAVFEPLNNSPFMRMFLKNHCLRPSCYACEAKATRMADITIADFWGIGNVVPELDDELGCSLVIARTSTGLAAISSIVDSLDSLEVAYEDAVRGNRCEFASVERPPERERFFDDLDELGYAGVVKKYGTPASKERVKRMAKGVLSKAGLLGVASKLRGGSSTNSMHYGMLIFFEGAVLQKQQGNDGGESTAIG